MKVEMEFEHHPGMTRKNKKIIAYLEPKWPLFWLQKALFWGLTFKNWGHWGSRCTCKLPNLPGFRFQPLCCWRMFFFFATYAKGKTSEKVWLADLVVGAPKNYHTKERSTWKKFVWISFERIFYVDWTKNACYGKHNKPTDPNHRKLCQFSDCCLFFTKEKWDSAPRGLDISQL